MAVMRQMDSEAARREIGVEASPEEVFAAPATPSSPRAWS
jgi:hypothetical protein